MYVNTRGIYLNVVILHYYMIEKKTVKNISDESTEIYRIMTVEICVLVLHNYNKLDNILNKNPLKFLYAVLGV